MRKLVGLCLCLCILALPAWAGQGFERWVQDFKREALTQGISPDTVTAALGEAQYLPRVIKLDRAQARPGISFGDYKRRVITQHRIDQGRAMRQKYSKSLHQAEARYNVPGSVIVALWGLETSYGKNTGGFDVISALATLAYDGRRSDFFRGELLTALRILDEGHIERAAMKGSWAGAMGQNQFMPSSFVKLAVDGNGDGRKDIWTSETDVFASTAHYLHQNGWNPHQRWGRKVKAPATLKGQSGLDVQKSLAEWQALGVRLPDGKDLPQEQTIKASLLQPDGPQGPSYLAYDNFRVIMHWNKSTYFALTVGLLSDLVAQDGPV
ncbi:MAG: lytic murein transglycosylase [Alphaproteobacteria bacterium]|nr:lytic murein transglycosylase [Alphaproteobacteria bacterium]